MIKKKFKNILFLTIIFFILLNHSDSLIVWTLNSIGVSTNENNYIQTLQSNEIFDEEFFNSNDLGIGLFFSTKYDQNHTSGAVNSDIGLYVTNNGKDFTYIAETGIQGRDPNIMYHNGVFYMATTKGGDNKGRVVVNIFKSTDLVNWTNVLDGIIRDNPSDNTSDTQYRYSLGTVENNKYNLVTNTWSPKWFKDGDNIYILVSTSRFLEDGSTLYYIKPDRDVLTQNGLTVHEEDFTNNSTGGFLVREYKEDGVIKKEYYEVEDNTGNSVRVRANCPSSLSGTWGTIPLPSGQRHSDEQRGDRRSHHVGDQYEYQRRRYIV